MMALLESPALVSSACAGMGRRAGTTIASCADECRGGVSALSNAPNDQFDSGRRAHAREPSRHGYRVAAWARRAARFARGALPQACALCAGRAGRALLCEQCERSLPRSIESCPRCALPSLAGVTCGRCLVSPPPWSAALAAYVYAFPVDRLLQHLKYGGALALADWAGDAIVRTVRGAGEPLPCDRVVALPLARSRQRQRGFNQAQEIARCVAAALHLPLAHPLRRVKDAPPQAALPWAGRSANVRDAFACDASVRGQRIVLIDDVMTTGATMREATHAALDAGAAEVRAWVVARTLPPHEQ